MGKKVGMVYSEEVRQEVYKLFSDGLTRKQIAVKTGLHYGTVTRWLREQPIESECIGTGTNADRHLCRTCCYRAKKCVNGCDYIVIMGRSRGCKVEDCNVYKRGKAIVRREHIAI